MNNNSKMIKMIGLEAFDVPTLNLYHINIKDDIDYIIKHGSYAYIFLYCATNVSISCFHIFSGVVFFNSSNSFCRLATFF